MMKRTVLFILITAIMCTSCHNYQNEPTKRWDEQLSDMMPYLGHRNWIVIADMAYPLQSGAGITTLFADEPYTDVMNKVKGMIDNMPHVFAHVYNDRELAFISEKDMPGVDSLKVRMKQICGDEAASLPHEDLIKRLDEAGKLYNVVIIKTPLTMAYTTTFFELDCKYWDAEKQAALDSALQDDTDQEVSKQFQNQ